MEHKNSFRILSLKLQGNKIFDDIELNFNDGNDASDTIYSTVIIGPNGTGKSYLLRIISELFLELYFLKNENSKTTYINGRVSFKYEIDGDTYEYTNFNTVDKMVVPNEKPFFNRTNLLKNGELIPLANAILPNAVIAVANLVSDKFHFSFGQSDLYFYRGVRTNNGSANNSSKIKQVIEDLFVYGTNEIALENIEHALSFLGYEKELFISYIPNFNKVISRDGFTEEEFKDYFENNKKYTDRETIPYSVGHYKSISQNKKRISELVIYLKFIKENLSSDSSYHREYFGFDIFNKKNNIRYDLIKDLYRLDLLRSPSISFQKQNANLEIDQISSGEFHFIVNILSVLALIKDNSLVLFDEPENSFHPNWQMKFISFLNEILKKYKSCHFIFATHSHFLISDLKSENSKIIGLMREGKIKEISFPENMDTYGLSTEEILYNVFKVKTVRNHFIESDLTDLLGLIAENSTDKSQIEKLLSSIQSIKTTSNDPLNAVVEEAKAYLETI